MACADRPVIGWGADKTPLRQTPMRQNPVQTNLRFIVNVVKVKVKDSLYFRNATENDSSIEK